MPDPLITLDTLRSRLGPGVAVDLDQASARIEDASALVRAEASGTLDATTTTTTPAVVVAVVVSVVQRALLNPSGYGSERIGDYSFGGADGSGVFLTALERRQVRKAVGIGSVGSIELSGYLPIPTQYDTNKW